ncbi:MAG: rhomboid family intramembrane serine protease [Phycisphaerales bacterium]|nr:rhomboid family intramembrane serine protease [Planctomycetota bacterium]
MLFPFGTDRPLRRPTLVNHLLLLLNFFAFCLLLVGTAFEGERWQWAVETLGLSRNHHPWWSFISYTFVHSGGWHLLGNLIILWVFGPCVEDRFGRLGYIAFYFAAGAFAGLAHMAAAPVPVVGASGAISGVTGAFLVLFPRTVIRTFVFFFMIGVFNIPAMWFICFAIARDLIGAGTGGSNISYAAHFGGYIFGISLSLLLLVTGILKREDYDLFFMIRQARRRQEITEAYRISQQRIRAEQSDPSGRVRVVIPDQPEVPVEVAQARSALSAAITSDDRASLPTLYASLQHAVDSARKQRSDVSPALEVLSRRAQLDLANRLFEMGERQHAARAYRGFLSVYEKDAESGVVRVMLALLMVRYLEQGQQAAALLESAIAALKDKDAEHTALARALLEEIRPRSAPTA